MTVYSGRKTINLIIIALIIAAGAANLFISNSIASQRFAIDVKKKELHTIGNALAAREVALGEGTNITNLLSAVQHRGMVPGQPGDALFLNTGVAYINGSAQGKN